MHCTAASGTRGIKKFVRKVRVEQNNDVHNDEPLLEGAAGDSATKCKEGNTE